MTDLSHSREKDKINPVVFYTSAGLILLFSLTTILFRDFSALWIGRTLDWVSKTFGWYYLLAATLYIVFVVCIVVGRAEAFAAKKGPALSALDGFSIGMGATCAMFVLGSLREIIGNGTLFDGADALLGSWAKVLRVEIFHTDSPFLLAMLPPGAFIGLGLMLAGKYLIDERMKKRRAEAAAERALPNGETGNV